jgi:hypothetical protein
VNKRYLTPDGNYARPEALDDAPFDSQSYFYAEAYKAASQHGTQETAQTTYIPAGQGSK